MIRDTLTKCSVTTKMLVAILAVLALILAVGTFLLRGNVKAKVTDTYLESVYNLFNSFEYGVKGSLERGQMKTFQKLLLEQKRIPGVVNASLYDKNAIVNLSSSGEEMVGKEMLPDIKQRLYEEKTTIEYISGEYIHIISPQIVVKDCIRCHIDWAEDVIGGSIAMTYDLSSLNRAS